MSAEARVGATALRHAALAVHAALVESERLAHEREHGRVETPALMLELVMRDARFAWLRPLSELIVALDQMLEQPELAIVDPAAARVEVELLVDGDAAFRERYRLALQADPALVAAHAALRGALAALPLPEQDDGEHRSARERWTAIRPRARRGGGSPLPEGADGRTSAEGESS